MIGKRLDWQKTLLITAAIVSLGGCGSDDETSDSAGSALAVPSVSFVAPGESLDLANYTLAHRYDLPVGTGSNKLTAEASAVTYNKSTGTLFLVGDHGTSVVQVGRDGAFIDSMTLPEDATKPQGTAIYDPEGIAWVEGNTFVLSEERDRKATRISYLANTTASASTFKSVTLGSFSPNLGNEGLSYDPVSGGFIFVKEKTPQGVFLSTLDFTAGTASNGSATTEPADLFNPTVLGAADLADVYALSNVLPTTAADRNHLILLSHESGMLYKTDRSGNLLSRLDIGIAPQHEGIAVDENKVIYVANELGGGAAKPQLWVYEPTTSSTAVGVGSNVYLTFAQAISAGTGSITLSGGGEVRTIAISDADQIKISGNTLAIKPLTDLKPGTSYTVQAPAGIVRAASGGNTSPAVSTSFTTRQETVAPTLSGTVPASNAIGVTSSHIIFTFSEAVKAGTGNVVISGTGGDTRTIAITDTTQVTISGNTVDVNPLADLNPATSYSVEVASGVVTDLSGNAFAGLTGAGSLKFTTAAAGSSGATTLYAGDVLFVAANADAVDAIGFVLLKAVGTGTQIHFTDKDYSAASPTLWPTNEAAFTWTADADYPAGTLVTIQTDNASLPANKGVVSGSSGGISSSAETYYAFQGTITDAAAGSITVSRFLAAINLGTAAGDIPSELTTAGSYIHFAEDNVKYAGSLDRSNIATFTALVKDVANWEKSDATAFPLVSNSFFDAATPSVGGTTLQAGDLIFIAANSDTTDALAFVLLKDVVAGTQIHFTDKDYNPSAIPAWPSNESLWTWTADADYPAGIIITVQPDNTVPVASKGTTSGAGGGMSQSGETYYAFQGSISGGITVDNFVAALNIAGAAAGNIPSALTAAGAYQEFAEDDVKFTAALDRSNLVTFVSNVKNTANWAKSDTTAFSLIDNSLFGGTHLDAGDVLFLGANSSTPDALAFVILKPVVAGTLIHFTDKDYVVAAAWPTNESGWTWAADTAYPAGTIVNIRPDTAPLTPSVGTAYGKDGGVGGSETYYAFQGDIINATTGKLLVDRFIATLHVGSSVSGAIPTGLAGADLSFSQSNAKYTGSLDISDLSAFSARVKDTANWTQQTGAFTLTSNQLFP